QNPTVPEMGISPGRTLCTQLSGTQRAKRTFASLRRWTLSSSDFRAKGMQGSAVLDIAVHPRAPLCATPPTTAKRATRRDSYDEACCLRIGQANRSRPRETRCSVNPKRLRDRKGNQNSMKGGPSDEDENKIQIHAPQSRPFAVGSLRGRHCNFHRRMRGSSLRNGL